MESVREEMTVKENPLNNQIILTEIFKWASTPLKNCRLVSKFWNETVLSLPNTRLALKLTRKEDSGENSSQDSDQDESTIEDSEAFQYFGMCCTLVDGRLAKRISAASDLLSFDWKLMHICDKFSDRIQILKLCIEGGNSLKPIFQVLKNCCPNLKQLRIEGKFIQAKDLDLFSPGELPKKPNLTLFSLTCWNFYPEIEFVTALANFIQLVVKASPNLKVVTIPWGFYPNLPKSKHLESLTIALDNVYPSDVADTQNVSKLLEMLRQVDNHLVNLCFGTDQNQYMLVPSENYDFKKFRFRLSRRMPKLRKFSNRIVEMFQCADFLQNIEMMPSVETLLIGRELKELRSVDEILRGICDKKMILAGVRKLELIELYDPRLLDGVATAFPNVEALEMNRLWVTDFEAEVTRLEVDVILEGCRGWGRLKRLKVTLPKYPTEMGAFIQALLQGRELFQRLATLEINTYDGDFGTYELSEVEMDMFKQLLLEMDGMDRVTIHKISFGEDLVENILTFMESNNLDVGKFRLYDGSPYRVGD